MRDLANAQTGLELVEDRRRKSLCHDVRVLKISRDMHNTQITDSHHFSDKVNVQLDMLCSTVMYWVLRQVHSGDVVTVNDCGLLALDMEFVQEVV